MESTIRFTNSSSEYTCKHLNLIMTQNDETVNIENINDINVLSINGTGSANIQLAVDKDDNDFTLTIKNFGLNNDLDSSTTISKRISSFIGFGYPHNVSGIPFVFTASNTFKDLVITKSNGTVNIVFDNTQIGMITNIKGPILDMAFNIVKEDIIDTEYISICIGDIIYETI